jgi:putative intracellular protease/amidase
MKKLIVLLGAMLLLGLALSCQSAPGQNATRILLIAREKSDDMAFMLQKEVFPMIELLKKAGYRVVVASQSGTEIEDKDFRLAPEIKLADVVITDFVGVVVPCMAAGSYTPPRDGIEVLKKAAATGLPIAAQNSDEMLIPAGLYTGRHVATSPGVVRDGTLLTSYNCPYTAEADKLPVDTPALIKQFISIVQAPR